MTRARYNRLECYHGFRDTLSLWQTSTCAVVGLGGLGSGLALHLARIGVRRLVLADRDIVDQDNLGHQWLYTEAHAAAGLPKAHAAAETLSAVNADTELVLHLTHLGRHNIGEVLEGVNLLFDGLDNYYGRFLLNDWALATGTPYFYAGVVRGELSARAIVPNVTGCLRCMLDLPPSPDDIHTCAAEGLFPPLLGVANALQLHAANRHLAGEYSEEHDVLYSLELPRWQIKELRPGRRPDCPACAGRYEFLDGTLDSVANESCAGNHVEIQLTSAIELARLYERLTATGKFSIRRNEYCLVIDSGPLRYTVFPGGKIVLTGGDAVELNRFIATYLGV